MKNRKLLLIVSLVLALTMSLGGTLAYLTDTEEAVNVMTLGNVDIEQNEIGADGKPFEQSQPLYPAYDNGTEMVGTIVKKVSVENTGSSDAYVRTWMAFEAGNITDLNTFKALINIDFAVENVEWLDGVYEIDGQKYFIANVLYTEAVKPGDTVNSLESFYMASSAGNDDVAQFGNTYEVLVLSQAVQTNNMPGAAAAMEAAFPGMVHPWKDKDIAELPTVVVRTAADLKAALEEGGKTVVLGADIDMGDEMVTIPAGVTARLDLAGHDITADHSSKSGESTSLFNVKKGASLTINGDGNVHFAVPASQKVTATINNDAGNVTINGGNYTMEYDDDWQVSLIPTIVDNNSNVGDANLTINGGTFTHHRNMFRNFSNAASHNGYKTVAKIVINGGTFIADGDGTAAIWNQKPSASVPAGAGVVEINGGTFAGVTVDDEFNEDAVQPEQTAVKIVSTAEDLVNAFANIKTGDHIILMADIDMTGKTLDATNGNKGFTLQGNDHTISNLKGTEQGLFVNNTGSADYYFYNVNLKNCQVNATTNYAGLFVGNADTCDELVIEGCTVTDCTVKSGKYAAAFVAYTAGWNKVNDGPVYSDVTIKDCKMIGGSITGGGSTAVAVAHSGANPDTTTTITNLQVNNVAINGEDAEHTGIVVGTANIGKTIISNVSYSGVTGNYNTATNLYGRFVPGTTGALTIDGVAVN